MRGCKVNPNSNVQLATKAQADGLMTFTGSPCIKCGNCERRANPVSSPCIICDRARIRKAYAANPSDRIAASAKWAKENQEYVNAHNRARDQLRKEKACQQQSQVS